MSSVLEEDITFINALHKFERRSIHHQILYAWVDAFRDKMPQLNITKAISYFYQRHGIDNFNTKCCGVEYRRMQKEIIRLDRDEYFKIKNPENILRNYQKTMIVENMLYASTAAYRTIFPYMDVDKAIRYFFKWHNVDRLSLETIDIQKIKLKVRELEKKDHFDMQKEQV